MGAGSERAWAAPGLGRGCGFRRLADVRERGSRAEERGSSAGTAACGGRRNTAGSLAGRAACGRKTELLAVLGDNRDRRRAVACEVLRELRRVRPEDATPRRSAVEWEIPGCAGSGRGHSRSAGSEWLLVELHASRRWLGAGGQPARVQLSWVLESKCPLAEVPSKTPSSQNSLGPELPNSRCRSPAPGLRCPSARCSSPSPASAGAARRSSHSTCCHRSRWPA